MSDLEHTTSGKPMSNEGHPTAILYETLSGVVIQITPLSILSLRAIHLRAEREFPYPDKTEYQIESAVMASGFLPAEENPAYIEACQAIDRQRNDWSVAHILDVACSYPQYPTREALVAAFRPQLEKLRRVADLGDDDYENTLDHCVFTGRHDKQMVIWAAEQNEGLMLTAPEVVEGIRYFRLELSEQARRRLAGQTRRAEIDHQPGVEPAARGIRGLRTVRNRPDGGDPDPSARVAESAGGLLHRPAVGGGDAGARHQTQTEKREEG